MDQPLLPLNQPWITHDDRDAVDEVLRRGELMDSKQVVLFEKELAAYLGRKYVACTSSGSGALLIAHRATVAEAMIPRRQVGAFGFIATPHAASLAGYEVEFIDHACEYTLGEPPAAIPHYEARNLVVDAAQGFGAVKPGFWRAECYSFNANKPICCIGGAVATDDWDLYFRIVTLRDQGRNPLTDWEGRAAITLGSNFRMSAMSAALGRSQLRRIETILSQRASAAALYAHFLPPAIERPAERASWFMYPICIAERNRVQRLLWDNGLQTRSCVDWFLPGHPCYADSPHNKKTYPHARALADQTLLLPIWPGLHAGSASALCKALGELGAFTPL